MKPAILKIIVTYLNEANEQERIEIEPTNDLHQYLTNLDKHKFIFFKEKGMTLNTSRIVKVENTTKDIRRFDVVEKNGKVVAVET